VSDKVGGYYLCPLPRTGGAAEDIGRWADRGTERDRKYALSLDNNFIHDLKNFPGFVVVTARRPENLSYDK